MTEKTINITESEYQQLLDDSILLNCLRNAGVDNWDGWDFAIEEYQEINGESE